MGFRLIALVFFLAGVALLIWFAFNRTLVPIYAAGFCWFVAILLFVLSFISRRGGPLFRNKPQV